MLLISKTYGSKKTLGIMFAACICIALLFLLRHQQPFNIKMKDSPATLHKPYFQKPSRRFLLFTSAGDKSNVKQWIGSERNYDIVVVYYSNSTFMLDVDELYTHKDTKFPNLKWYMQTDKIDKYAAIAVWDDDIVASVDSINSLFLEMVAADADIFSPCHTRNPCSQLLKLNEKGVRNVEFIAMNAPMFLPWILNDFMLSFNPKIKGWGTDIWYSYRCIHLLDKCVMKISDTTCVTNPRTRNDGTKEMNKAQPVKIRHKIWSLYAKTVLHQPISVPKSAFLRIK